jgi:ligand-binding sensor domain-containing protein/AraC-like DNA-binding protein
MNKHLRIGNTTHIFIGIILIHLLFQTLVGVALTQKVSHYKDDQWNKFDEIPPDKIVSISQTPDGYLWLATKKGLIKFDGLKFYPVQINHQGREKSGTIKAADVDKLFRDREGILWIGRRGRMTSYDYRTREFKTYLNGPGISPDEIRCIGQGEGNELWVSFVSGNVARFANRRFESLTVTGSAGLEGKRVNSILKDKNGNIFFVTRTEGIFLYEDNRLLQNQIISKEKVKGAVVTMIEDHNGTYWLGTDSGLIKITGDTTRVFTTEHGLSHSHISSILEDRQHNLWIGTTKGLNRLVKRKDGTVSFEHFYKSKIIWTLYEDREGSLWVGTFGNGLKRLRNARIKSFSYFEKNTGSVPISLCPTPQGEILVGTSDGKILKFHGNRYLGKIQPLQLENSIISALAIDAHGEIWIGTGNGEVFREKNGLIIRVDNRGTAKDWQITCLLIDSRQNKWFGSYNGLKVLNASADPAALQSFRTIEPLQDKRVHYIYEDKRHNIWVATNNGVLRLKTGNYDQLDSKYYLPGISVTSILETSAFGKDDSGILWLTTRKQGLKRLDTKTGNITAFTTSNGMNSDKLIRVFEDKHGNVYAFGGTGILRINRTEIKGFCKGEIERLNCITFGKSDGLKSTGFTNPFSQHSAVKTRQEEFWFINTKEILILSPDEIRFNIVPPPVNIEKVIFEHQPVIVRADESIGTYYEASYIRIHFSATTLISAGETTFRYKLEGFDKTWRYLSHNTQRVVEYDGLEPGTYKFRLNASNADGVWNTEERTVTFKLAPYFYKIHWFTIALLILGLVTGGFLYKKHDRATKKKQNAPVTGKQNGTTNGLSLPPEFVRQCVAKLMHLMQVEKIYRDETLNLPGLAEKISIARHQLSEILNKHLKRNFSDFVNYYRIQEAKERLGNSKNTEKIQTIAYDTGFNTEAAFYSTFKKFTGMTPGQFRKKTGGKEE